ncbi:MAG: hypothetical protein ABW187_00910 [Dokdonella sp.]
MFMKFILVAASALASAALLPAAQADVLATPTKKSHRAADNGNVPSRGMSMAQVEQRFGAPLEKLPSAGGDTARHPVIHRWRYRGYTVYFERSHVIHSVLDTAATAAKS